MKVKKEAGKLRGKTGRKEKQSKDIKYYSTKQINHRIIIYPEYQLKGNHSKRVVLTWKGGYYGRY